MAPTGIIENETGTQCLIGYVLDVGQPDRRARCRLTLTDAHLNRHGVVHGGIVATLLDNALGATASLTVDETGRVPFLTVTLTTSFIASAPAGAVLSAVGTVRGGGRSLLFLDGEVTDQEGTLIAQASGVFKRVPHR